MNDTNDRRRHHLYESKESPAKLSESGRELCPEKNEAQRIRQKFADNPNAGGRPEDQLRRVERTQDSSSMRHMSDFDAKREVRLENFEIRENPEAYLRRQEGRGLDVATEREVGDAPQRKERKKPKPKDQKDG